MSQDEDHIGEGRRRLGCQLQSQAQCYEKHGKDRSKGVIHGQNAPSIADARVRLEARVRHEVL